MDELGNPYKCAYKVLILAVSMMDFATVPADLMSAFQLIPYQSAEDTLLSAGSAARYVWRWLA